jgi:hypothetical protein
MAFETSKWITSGDHVFTLGKTEYSVAKLLRLTRRRKARLYPIDELWGYSQSKVSGFSLFCFYHANTRYPVIALKNGSVVDGRHRLLKLKEIFERKNARVKFITKAELARCRR